MLRLRNSTLLSLVFAPIGWMIILSVGLPIVWGLGRTMDLWPLEAYPQEARLIETILGSWFTFALPLACFSAGRRSMSHLHPRYWWGWTRERYYGLPAWVALGAIFLIYLGLMAVLASGSEWLIEQLPASWGISSEDLPAQSIEELIVRSPVGYVLMFLSFVVTPAIVEEVFFRGYYQRLLYSWTGGHPWLPIIATAFVFSAIHLSVVGFAARFSSGIILGWVYQRTGGRLMPVILMHLLGNTIALVSLLLE